MKQTWDTRSLNKPLLEEQEVKRPLGSYRCRWKHNTEMNLKLKLWTRFIWLGAGTSGGLQ
jgi:hypothetical protein